MENSRSVFKLRAASRPARLLIFRSWAFNTVNPSKSCSVNGPVGFCNASRMAAFSPGSGMRTSCAGAVKMTLVKASVRRANEMDFKLSTLIGAKCEQPVPGSLWD